MVCYAVANGMVLAVVFSMTQSKPPNQSERYQLVPLATYSNYFEVGHNAFEFLIDFGQFQPEHGKVSMHSRMVTGPVHAKLISKLLSEAIARFEDEHGEIADLAAHEFDSLLVPPADFEKRAKQARTKPIPPIVTKR
jgi:Protein of unknown function (DUF3467)